MTEFAATVDGNDGFLLGPFDNQGAAFSFLLTDIGFSGTLVDPGIAPEAVAYSSDPAVVEDLGPPGGIQNFGSGAVFTDILDDPDFAKVLQTTSGEGYGAGVHVGFAAFTGYAAGFAAGYETFHFKVKGDAANLGAFEVKFIGNGDTSQVYDLGSYGGVTSAGKGWLQVSIPMTDFAATVADNDGFLLGPFDNQGAAFSFLMTDIGFSGTAAADPGTIPDAVAYSSDPSVVEDVGPPGGIQNFGSGAVFVDIFDDPDFAKVLQTTSGEGYGVGVHVGFAAFTGYAAGFASGYENFLFKVKADAANLGAFEVKFIGNGDTSQVYDLTTYGGVTDLGNGWLQVSIPMTDFAATVAANDGFLLGPFDNQGAAFSFLMTDIGFTGGGI